MMRKSVGLRPFALGGGSSAQTSSNSASDISVEYRSRMTSYFTRSASFQGIANLPKLLQIQGIKPREASQPISGQALRVGRISADDHFEGFAAESAANIRWDFLERLHLGGRRPAEPGQNQNSGTMPGSA